MAKPDDEDFLAALDIAAKHLLEKAGVSDKVETDVVDVDASLAERVKAFEAVVDWAKTRRGLKPEEKKASAFDGIKQQFNGSSPRRRGTSTRRSKAPEADGAAGDAAPADVIDLFGGAEEA